MKAPKAIIRPVVKRLILAVSRLMDSYPRLYAARDKLDARFVTEPGMSLDAN